MAEARERTQKVTIERDQAPELAARQGVTYARDHLFERSAVESGRSILTAALDRSMGEASFSQVRHEFDRRKQAGEFRTVDHGLKHEGQQFTTATMVKMEREILAHVEKGNRRGYDDPMLVEGRTRIETEDGIRS